ncbi:hypothetical protein WICMUC_002332 [Wickerhamomyces mucosus]|uniref:Uncharacterized protein n=1 Tax=Wickerhamomyces mucosus TaxID=1378264 RepID=A0A9P8TEL8_9ASCO|nr:hypothetical protein WICMUC_002332 [Wickerhamomyces mucosus]
MNINKSVLSRWGDNLSRELYLDQDDAELKDKDIDHDVLTFTMNLPQLSLNSSDNHSYNNQMEDNNISPKLPSKKSIDTNNYSDIKDNYENEENEESINASLTTILKLKQSAFNQFQPSNPLSSSLPSSSHSLKHNKQKLNHRLANNSIDINSFVDNQNAGVTFIHSSSSSTSSLAKSLATNNKSNNNSNDYSLIEKYMDWINGNFTLVVILNSITFFMLGLVFGSYRFKLSKTVSTYF